jgi:hypothetical protein
MSASRRQCLPLTESAPTRARFVGPARQSFAMAADLPPSLRGLAESQHGILSRAQILHAGLTKDIIYSRLRRGSWQWLHAGVYAAFSGEPSRLALLWAAVLYAGPTAMLSHQTAAELHGLTDTTNPLIHVTVTDDRRVRQRAGLIVHVSARAMQAVHPARTPPQTRVEETVLDLWQSARTLDDAIGWVTRAIGRRLTTETRLRQAMSARGRIRWRKPLAELLSPDLTGVHSVLEYRYVRGVERPHRLPRGSRQARAKRGGHSEYRDTLYEAYRLVVELDGTAAHPADRRWQDIRRDNAAAAAGLTTLRYSWLQISSSPCQIAAEIGEVLARRGYAGVRPCAPGCPVACVTQPRRSSARQVSPARSGVSSRASAAGGATPPPRCR